MTFFSNEINDFLDKIYLYEISHWNGDGEMTPVHDYFESRLRSIDSLPSHSLSTRFPFNRDRLFVLVIGRFIFGYRFDGTNAAVDIYRKLESMGDWLDVVIPESRQPKKDNHHRAETTKNNSRINPKSSIQLSRRISPTAFFISYLQHSKG